MSDAHLTDHEWRLKQAAEGKAIYSPGKTDEQVKAEMKAYRTPRARRLSVSDEELTAILTAADGVSTHFWQAAKTFEFLACVTEEGAISDDHGLGAVLFLLGVAFRSLDETDGKPLGQLRFKIEDETADSKEDAA
ncbi:hypothetical protein [Mameliella alba]|uniref:Uncharacterized protein n=1 Tax=Mameliella alba TaxID=561184 RepID=A0A0B3SRD1_9RHOB|nr:hypothetical protein [Mameliella alba]KHQ52999.1 hypothetical protein OA50_02544 [Mameliella alba]